MARLPCWSKADRVASKHERKRSFVISSEAMGAVPRPAAVRGGEAHAGGDDGQDATEVGASGQAPS